MDVVSEDVAIHGGKAAEPPAPSVICATGFWVVPRVSNWITGEKKPFDCLELMPILAEAMGSLQHSFWF